MVSNFRRIYKGAQDCVVGILGFQELPDTALLGADEEKLEFLLGQALKTGDVLQWHFDPEGYCESADQRLFDGMDKNQVFIDDAMAQVREGNLKPLDSFRE